MSVFFPRATPDHLAENEATFAFNQKSGFERCNFSLMSRVIGF